MCKFRFYCHRKTNIIPTCYNVKPTTVMYYVRLSTFSQANICPTSHILKGRPSSELRVFPTCVWFGSCGHFSNRIALGLGGWPLRVLVLI